MSKVTHSECHSIKKINAIWQQTFCCHFKCVQFVREFVLWLRRGLSMKYYQDEQDFVENLVRKTDANAVKINILVFLYRVFIFCYCEFNSFSGGNQHERLHPRVCVEFINVNNHIIIFFLIAAHYTLVAWQWTINYCCAALRGELSDNTHYGEWNVFSFCFSICSRLERSQDVLELKASWLFANARSVNYDGMFIGERRINATSETSIKSTPSMRFLSRNENGISRASCFAISPLSNIMKMAMTHWKCQSKTNECRCCR